jgi:hypothetical protein
MRTKLVCCNCGWRGSEETLLRAANPFDATDTVRGCPECKGVEQFEAACDEPDCWEPVCAGTPTANGYRVTCGAHVPGAEKGQS